MATIISEGEGKRKLTFTFSDKWQIYKYDEPIPQNFHFKYRGQGLKAVDFLATSEKSLLLMEVKYVLASDENSSLSFSPYRDKDLLDEIRQRLSPGHREIVMLSSKRPYIVNEVVKKAKDTVLGLLASRRQEDKNLAIYNEALLLDQKPIVLVLFLERDGELNQLNAFKKMASDLQLAIEQKVSFLGNIQVLVVNTLTIPQKLEIEVKQGM